MNTMEVVPNLLEDDCKYSIRKDGRARNNPASLSPGSSEMMTLSITNSPIEFKDSMGFAIMWIALGTQVILTHLRENIQRSRVIIRDCQLYSYLILSVPSLPSGYRVLS